MPRYLYRGCWSPLSAHPVLCHTEAVQGAMTHAESGKTEHERVQKQAGQNPVRNGGVFG